VTGLNQALAQIEAMAPDEQFLAANGVAEATVAGIQSQVHVIEHVPDRLVSRESDGDEVGQKGDCQGGEIDHRHGIYRATTETMSQKLVSNILVPAQDLERLSGARSPAEPPGAPEREAAAAGRSGDYGPRHLA